MGKEPKKSKKLAKKRKAEEGGDEQVESFQPETKRRRNKPNPFEEKIAKSFEHFRNGDSTLIRSMQLLFEAFNRLWSSSNKRHPIVVDSILHHMQEEKNALLRPALSAILCTFLNKTPSFISETLENLLYGDKKNENLSNTYMIYLVSIAIESKRIPKEVEKIGRLFTILAEFVSREDDASISIFTTNVLCSLIQKIELTEEKLSQYLGTYLNSFLLNKVSSKNLTLAECQLFMAIYEKCELYLKTELSITDLTKFLSNHQFLEVLIKSQNSMPYYGVHPVWSKILSLMSNSSDSKNICSVLDRIDKEYFSENITSSFPQLMANPELHQRIKKVSNGFLILNVVLNSKIPSKLVIAHSLTQNLIKQIARSLDLNASAHPNPNAKSNVRNEHHNSEHLRFLLKKEVLKHKENASLIIKALGKCASRPDGSGEQIINKIKSFNMKGNYVTIIVTKIQSMLQQNNSLDDIRKLFASLDQNSQHIDLKISRLSKMVPKNEEELENTPAEYISEMLNYVFENSLLGSKPVPEKVKTFLTHSFFKMLSLLSRHEFKYYEKQNNGQNELMNPMDSPWSEKFYTLMEDHFAKNKELQVFSEEALSIRQKVQNILENILEPLVDGNNRLEIMAIKILIYRVLLLQVVNPEIIDDVVADDIGQYLENTYSKKSNAKEDNSEHIGVLTDVLLYLLSKSDHLANLITLIFLQNKPKLTEESIELLYQSMEQQLGLEVEGDEDDNDDDEKEEVVGDSSGKKQGKKTEKNHDKMNDDDDDGSEEEEEEEEEEEMDESDSESIEDEKEKKNEDKKSNDDDDDQINTKFSEIKTLVGLNNIENNGDNESTGTLDDDEMFKRDKIISEMFKQARSKRSGSGESLVFARRVLSLIETLFLYNFAQQPNGRQKKIKQAKPEKLNADTSELALDKKFKFMLLIKLIRLAMDIQWSSRKIEQTFLSKSSKPEVKAEYRNFLRKMLELLNSIQTNRYIYFLSDLTDINSATSKLVKKPEETALSSRTKFDPKIGEVYISTFEELVERRHHKNIPLHCTLMKSIGFISTVLYYQQGMEWGSKVVDILCKRLPIRDNYVNFLNYFPDPYSFIFVDMIPSLLRNLLERGLPDDDDDDDEKTVHHQSNEIRFIFKAIRDHKKNRKQILASESIYYQTLSLTAEWTEKRAAQLAEKDKMTKLLYSQIETFFLIEKLLRKHVPPPMNPESRRNAIKYAKLSQNILSGSLVEIGKKCTNDLHFFTHIARDLKSSRENRSSIVEFIKKIIRKSTDEDAIFQINECKSHVTDQLAPIEAEMNPRKKITEKRKKKKEKLNETSKDNTTETAAETTATSVSSSENDNHQQIETPTKGQKKAKSKK